jgi:hypothetical protein
MDFPTLYGSATVYRDELFVVVLPPPLGQMPAWHHKLGHDRFL